jgi:hypothetical protein
MSLLDIFGWIGSGAVVFSLLQTNMLRLRVINMVACLMLVAYSSLIESWPMVGMNAAIALINAYFLFRMYQASASNGGSAPVTLADVDEEITLTKD